MKKHQNINNQDEIIDENTTWLYQYRNILKRIFRHRNKYFQKFIYLFLTETRDITKIF